MIMTYQEEKFNTLIKEMEALTQTRKKGKKARKQKKTKRKGKKGKRSRKQRGGANPLNYSYLTGLSTQNTSLPLAFGTTSGTDYINKTLNAQPIPSNAMSYESPFPTLA